MPDRLSVSSAEFSIFGGSNRALQPALLFVVIAFLLGLVAIRISDPLHFLGALTVAVTLGSVAVILFSIQHMSRRRDVYLHDIFDSFLGQEDDPAYLIDQRGKLLRVNAAASGRERGDEPSDIARILERRFTDAHSLEHRLRAGIRSSNGGHEALEDHDGVLCDVRVSECGADKQIWTIRPVKHASSAEPALDTICPLAVVEIDKAGKVGASNVRARNLNFVEGEPFGDVLGTDFRQGALYEISDAREKFRGYAFDCEDDGRQAIFVPVQADDLTGATPDQFLDALPVALARVSANGELIYLNNAAQKLLGEDAKKGASFNALLEGLGRSMDERIKDMMRGREHMRTEVARAKVNGHEVFLQVTLDRVLLDGETSVLAFLNDATELKTLEAQFVQSQKMQAVGQLAGGVAHDFNNLLTAINGHCDLILMRHETSGTDYGDLIQIRHNANRAASLVGQLLAFSRKQTLRPKVIDLYDTLCDLNHLLNRLLGEKVTLRIEHGEHVPSVRVDERQLEQVIMNLVVNARDAMPNGGEVVIQTHEAIFEEDTKMDRVVIPFGKYVKIDVTDTGVGIPEEKISKIFEPFFTTKGVGEGTGLGLSTAYGIIKQTGGFIFAVSEVGAGTTFTLYLPTHSDLVDETMTGEPEKAEPTDLTGRGVVLLVEDEVPVRSFAARALNIRGYTVIEAGSAEEALEILENKELKVDVFVSDVIMPGMDGPTWVRMAQKDRPNTRVVFVSGYAEDVFEGGQITVPNATFLPKPFSLNELTHTVKMQLEADTV